LEEIKEVLRESNEQNLAVSKEVEKRKKRKDDNSSSDNSTSSYEEPKNEKENKELSNELLEYKVKFSDPYVHFFTYNVSINLLKQCNDDFLKRQY
jgi:hypothetical protein